MSKKHFIALADAIKNGTALITLTQIQVEALADFCQSQNPNFNRERWLWLHRGHEWQERR